MWIITGVAASEFQDCVFELHFPGPFPHLDNNKLILSKFHHQGFCVIMEALIRSQGLLLGVLHLQLPLALPQHRHRPVLSVRPAPLYLQVAQLGLKPGLYSPTPLQHDSINFLQFAVFSPGDQVRYGAWNPVQAQAPPWWLFKIVQGPPCLLTCRGLAGEAPGLWQKELARGSW